MSQKAKYAFLCLIHVSFAPHPYLGGDAFICQIGVNKEYVDKFLSAIKTL